MGAIDRREFLKRAAAGGAGAFLFAADARRGFAQEATAPAAPAAAKQLPRRLLGSTGRELPRLGLACSPFAAFKPLEKGLAIIARAHELGVRYFDVSADAGNGRAESLLGKALKGTKREELWLTTHIDERRSDAARHAIEESLVRLGTSYLDAVLIPATLDRNVATEVDSVLDELRRAKREKVIRHFGLHSLKGATYLKRAIDRFPYELAMFPVNPADPSRASFVTEFLPAAAEKKVGVIAMQIFPPARRDGAAPADELSRKECVTYALGLPQVEIIVPACTSIEMLEELHAVALDFVQPSDEALREIEQRGAKNVAPAPDAPEAEESEKAEDERR